MHKQSPDNLPFQELQYQFAGHIRNPESCAAPEGVEDRRMAVYRELFYNNIMGFLSSNFPVLKQISSEEYWQQLGRDFLVEHRCETPYFLEIGEEFIRYIQKERTPQPEDPPFMAELIHYEWVELALEASQIELPLSDVDVNGDLLQGHPVQSPLAWSLSYNYPVHCIREEYQPEHPSDQPTFLIAYRTREDEVSFMEVNAVSARLLYLLSEDEQLTGREALRQIAEEIQHPDIAQVVAGGLQTLEQLRAKGIVLGTKI